eukprot:gene8529-biopygen6133
MCLTSCQGILHPDPEAGRVVCGHSGRAQRVRFSAAAAGLVRRKRGCAVEGCGRRGHRTLALAWRWL